MGVAYSHFVGLDGVRFAIYRVLVQQESVLGMRSNPVANDPLASLTQAHIDTTSLHSNLAHLRERTAGLELIAVVKANAYGHDVGIVAPVLERSGINAFAVATPAEGVQLRKLGIAGRVIVFAPPAPPQIGLYEDHDLEVVVESPEGAESLVASSRRLSCHIKVDTGMGRLGVSPDDAAGLVRIVEKTPRLRLAGIFTHLAASEILDNGFTRLQVARFRNMIASMGGAPAPVHLANSAAIYTSPESVDPSLVDAARIGIALYGLLDLPQARDTLRPVMTFSSRISAVKTVPAGSPISYGSKWTAPVRTRIAVVGAGYADGYPRMTRPGAFVGISGALWPVVGAVCMDMLMINLGQPDGPGGEIRVGDAVTLFGPGSPSCFDVSGWADTIPYVTVCAVSARVPRLTTD